jgi:L-amino acid N-acyltransferase YncA
MQGEAGVIVREATDDDLPAIVAVYDEMVDLPSVLWRDDHTDVDDRKRWMHERREQGYPVLVAEADGEVVGYASFGNFRSFPGYRPTVEHSVHISTAHTGRGIGQALLDAVTDRAVALGKSVMVAGVDADNAGSIRFHERNGFREVGRMPAVGRKFDRPVELVLMQRDIP